MVSMYRFMEGWFLEPGAVPIADFAQMRLANGGKDPGYWQAPAQLVGTSATIPNVLLLSYEHMTDDAGGCMSASLAAFCGMPLDDDAAGAHARALLASPTCWSTRTASTTQ